MNRPYAVAPRRSAIGVALGTSRRFHEEPTRELVLGRDAATDIEARPIEVDVMADFRTRQTIRIVIMVAVMAVVIYGKTHRGTIPGEAVPFMFVFVLAATLFGIWNWRCPACKESLGGRSLNPTYCPSCQVQLQPE